MAIRVVLGEDSPGVCEGVRQLLALDINSIVLKLGLADAEDAGRRVKAALMFLAEMPAPGQLAGV